MSTLNVSSLKNSGSSNVNIGLNADGTATLAVISSGTAPAITTTGALWLDTSTPTAPILKVYNGTSSSWSAPPGGSVPPSPFPPASPVTGDIYYDTSTTPGVLKVYNGSAFVPVATTPGGISAPTSPQTGTTWYDTSVTPPVLKVWNGSAWVASGSTATGTAPTSPTNGQQWTDTSTNPPVLKMWNGSAWIPATVAISNGVAPTSPVTGQLWSDTSTNPATLKAWDGSAWVPVQAAGGGGSGTVTAVSGTAPIAVATGTTTPVVSITAGTARQLLQTNSGATGVEFASNIDIPGTLDVTGVATFDNIVSAPLGTAAAPSVTFTGDINTGLFSPGADELGLTTAGTQRITVGATGDVTVTGGNLTLNTQGDLRFADADSSNYVAFQAPATVAANVTWTLPAADGTAAGAVFSTDAAGVTSWNDLGNGVALNGTAIKVSIGSSSAPPAVSTATANAMTGSMYWDDVAGAMFYRYDNGGTPVWVQASAGGGGSSASDWTRTGTVLAPTTAGDTVQFSAGTAAAPGLAFVGDPNTGVFAPAADTVAVVTGGTERVRVTSAGKFISGITTTVPTGTSSSLSLNIFKGNTTSTSGGAYVTLANNSNTTGVSLGYGLGTLVFSDSEAGEYGIISCLADANAAVGNTPGRLVFSTTPSGSATPVERMRIDYTGAQYAYSIGDGITASVSSAAVSSGIIFEGKHSATAVNTGTGCFAVRYNGDVINTNNSYGAISDLKLKENIVDANSQWDDIKGLQVRNYNLKEETGQQTHTQIGLIAQEAELVSPGLVSESPDRDADGNDLGTVTKSVNYSVLYMKAVKALQEAMERIEVLEARLDAAGV